MAQCAGISASWSLRNADGLINLEELSTRENARKQTKQNYIDSVKKDIEDAKIAKRNEEFLLGGEEYKKKERESRINYEKSLYGLIKQRDKLQEQLKQVKKDQKKETLKKALNKKNTKIETRLLSLYADLQYLRVAAIFPWNTKARKKYITTMQEIKTYHNDPHAHLVYPISIPLDAEFAGICFGTLTVACILKSLQKANSER